ncbi:MAG: YibE/F family protein [Acutalibacteraceae bacterium]|nr:YibE/F family protein [Acutalibacteraceae bacterium]
MKNKQSVYQIVAVVVSALLIFLANLYVTGGAPVFKGSTEGETVRCRVIRVTDVKTDNVSGETEFVTVRFKAQALNTALRGKTLEVVQEIDRSFVFCPKQVEQNDKILVESYSADGETQYYFGDYVRITPLLWLLAIFCILIIVFSRMQGIKTVISLGFTCLSVFTVLIPAILNGHNIYLWSIVVCMFITVMTLSIISGFNVKAMCAGIGCVSGVLCAGLTVLISDKFLNMTGMLEEESVYLIQLYPDNPINLKAIIFAMIIVGAVGAVMDVSMSISSSLYELRLKSPNIRPSELMKSGFAIGRDMMGTMANTLVLAYIGSSLTSVLLLVAYNAGIEQVINKEMIVAEILQALAGSLGMLLTLPLTSAVCAAVYYNREEKKNASC